MSRLGKKPVIIPKGVDVKVEQDKVHAKGPKGTSILNLEKGISVKVEDNMLVVYYDDKLNPMKSIYGLYRSLVENLIEGVEKGFEKVLTLIGVGYRAALKGNKIDLQVGYSHPTELEIPKDIKVLINKGTEIVISGVDKQKVGLFASQVRSIRPPEPYKGKGIRYIDEYVRKKAGKAAKGK